jgi:ferredoxin-NADP reductase
MKSLNTLINAWMLQAIGRDRLEYFCSNTMNQLTRRLNPFLWSYELKGRVLQRRQETHDVMSFELLPNQYWQEPLAGQFVELSFSHAGKTLERAYSISTVNQQSFWITVKRQGQMSNALHDLLQVGDTVNLSGPFGQFVYRQQPRVLFLCAGSGITPCFSMLQQLLTLPINQRPSIQFYAQFSKPQDTIFGEQLKQMSQAGLTIDLAYSQAPEAGTLPPLNPENFGRHFPDFMEREIYLCGPQGFKQGLIEILGASGFLPERLHIEHFAAQAVALPGSKRLPEVYFSAANYLIQMRHEDLHKSLLDLGLEHGLNLEKGCRKGYCGSCKLVLHEGEVLGQTHGKAVYICNAYANSDRVVLGY